MTRLKKHLGQNILVDRNMIAKEAALAGDLRDSIVLEIGPGTGMLTKELAKKAKKVIAIEKDPEILEEAKRNVDSRNIEWILADAMKMEWPRFDKMVSNLPYYLSSEIIFKLLEQKFETAVLICQKEFGERMAGRPGKNYSRLTVNAQLRAKVELCGTVGKGCFLPAPKVDSVIVRLTPKEAKLPEIFGPLTRAVFSHKKKLLKNALVDSSGELGLSKEEAKELFKGLEKRAIELKPEEILELAWKIEGQLARRQGKS